MEHKDANHGKQRRKVAIDEANHGKQRRRSMKATTLLVYREWAKTSCNMHDKKIKVKDGAQQKKKFISKLNRHRFSCRACYTMKIRKRAESERSVAVDGQLTAGK